MEHSWDPDTSFCLRCGAARRDWVDGLRPVCNDGVIAISHIVARKRFDSLLAERLAYFLNSENFRVDI